MKKSVHLKKFKANELIFDDQELFIDTLAFSYSNEIGGFKLPSISFGLAST